MNKQKIQVKHRVSRLDVEFPEIDPHSSEYFVFLKIDGQKIPYEVDIEEFEASLKSSGDFSVFTSGALMGMTSLSATKVEHAKDMIVYHIMKGADLDRVVSFKKKNGEAIVHKIRTYLADNKVLQQISQRRVNNLIEEKLILLDELRHKNKVIKEYKIGFYTLFILFLGLVARMFFVK